MKGLFRTTIHMYFHIEHTHFRSQHALGLSMVGDFRSQDAHERSRENDFRSPVAHGRSREVISDRCTLTVDRWRVFFDRTSLRTVFGRVLSDRRTLIVALWMLLFNCLRLRSLSGS